MPSRNFARHFQNLPGCTVSNAGILGRLIDGLQFLPKRDNCFMLGHAKVSTTEDIYSHVIEDSKQQAGNVLAQVYYGEKRQKQA